MFEGDELRSMDQQPLGHGSESKASIAELEQALEVANVRVAELVAENMRLREQSVTDHLTGVFNMRHRDDQLRERVAYAKRYGAGFSIARIDIDCFKSVNSQHAQIGGDRVLRRFAKLLAQSCRQSDTLFRDGGDEFFIILQRTTVVEAECVLQRIQEHISSVPIKEIKKPLTFSYGVAEFTGQSIEELRLAADLMMQKNKEATKACRVPA